MKISPSTDAVKNYAAVNGQVTKKEARESLDMSVDKVALAFDNLIKSGHLRRIGHGLYQFVDAVEKPPTEIMDKIWRAMKISSAFTAADIAKLADSSTAYVYKRFRKYQADGYLHRAGIKKTGPLGRQKLWRLTKAGKAKAQNPRVETWKPDPVVRATVNLNRLVCSGVALRSRQMAIAAMKQLEIVKTGLNDVIDEN